MLTRATHAVRVLEIGTGRGETALEIVSALPADGWLITVEGDAATAVAARQALAAAGFARQATVMAGAASRYLHKLAGPFDLIVLHGDSAPLAQLHAGVIDRLRPGGLLVVSRVREAGDYNDVLAMDARLITTFLDIAGGTVIAVKRQDGP